MPDIYLTMQELDEVLAGLNASIDEFDSATGIADGIAEAIGRPDGRGALHGKANDFEDDWNNTRDGLKDNLDQIRTHLQDVIDGWRNWDAEAAAAMQSSAPDNAV